MSYTHRNSVQYTSGGLGTKSKSYTQTKDAEQNFSGEVTTAGASTFEVVLNPGVAIGSWYSQCFVADGASTIKIYEAANPTTNYCTIALTNGYPVIWSADHLEANPGLATGAGGTAANRDTVGLSTLSSTTTITLNAAILYDAPGA